MTRPVPPACLNLIHAFEGKDGNFEAVPTQDPAGNWEIGWSHKLPGPAYAGAPVNAAQADNLAQADLLLAATHIQIALGDSVVAKLTDGQWAAIIDFSYNVGCEAFAGSTLCLLIRQGRLDLAANEFSKWVFAHVNGKVVEEPGLVRRRKAEKALFAS